MNALGLLVVSGLVVPFGIQVEESPTEVEPSPFEVAFRVEPSEIEVGEPFELLVAVRHADDVPVPALDAAAVPDDLLWVVLDERRQAAVPDSEETGVSWTRFEVSLTALEPGEHVVPVLTLTLGGKPLRPFQDLQPDLVFESLPRIRVAGVLGEAEDEPRPLRGLEEIEADLERAQGAVGKPILLIAALVVLVALAAYVLIRIRRGSGARPAAGPAPEARLDGLAATDVHDVEALRDAHYELTRVIRETVDRATGRPLPGLVDEDWCQVASREPRFQGEGERALNELFRTCRAVKYEGVLPTEWALSETLQRARRVLELAHGPRAGAADTRRTA